MSLFISKQNINKYYRIHIKYLNLQIYKALISHEHFTIEIVQDFEPGTREVAVCHKKTTSRGSSNNTKSKSAEQRELHGWCDEKDAAAAAALETLT